MKMLRPFTLAALVTLTSLPWARAAQLSCSNGIQFSVGSFDLKAPNPSANAKNPHGALTVVTGVEELSTLLPDVGSKLSSCTLVYEGGASYTLDNVTLDKVDVVAGEQSSGTSGNYSYLQATFQVNDLSVSGGSGVNDGGKIPTGWDVAKNNSN
jgi:hypothetical protein